MYDMRLYQITENGVDETSELRNLIYLQQLWGLLNVSPGKASAVVLVDVINQKTGCDKELITELVGIGDNLVHRK